MPDVVITRKVRGRRWGTVKLLLRALGVALYHDSLILAFLDVSLQVAHPEQQEPDRAVSGLDRSMKRLRDRPDAERKGIGAVPAAPRWTQ